MVNKRKRFGKHGPAKKMKTDPWHNKLTKSELSVLSTLKRAVAAAKKGDKVLKARRSISSNGREAAQKITEIQSLITEQGYTNTELSQVQRTSCNLLMTFNPEDIKLVANLGDDEVKALSYHVNVVRGIAKEEVGVWRGENIECPAIPRFKHSQTVPSQNDIQMDLTNFLSVLSRVSRPEQLRVLETKSLWQQKSFTYVSQNLKHQLENRSLSNEECVYVSRHVDISSNLLSFMKGDLIPQKQPKRPHILELDKMRRRKLPPEDVVKSKEEIYQKLSSFKMNLTEILQKRRKILKSWPQWKQDSLEYTLGKLRREVSECEVLTDEDYQAISQHLFQTNNAFTILKPTKIK